MAQSKSRKNTSSNKKTSTRSKVKGRTKEEIKFQHEVSLVVSFAVCVLLFLCNFGIIGVVGDFVSQLLFGLIGTLSYVLPLFVFFLIYFGLANDGNPIARTRIICFCVIFVDLMIAFDLINGLSRNDGYDCLAFYNHGATLHRGGGVFGGSLAYALCHFLGFAGSWIVCLVICVICALLILRRPVADGFRDSRSKRMERKNLEVQTKEELLMEREERLQKMREDRSKKDALRKERMLHEREMKESKKAAKEDEKILRMNKKVSGVTTDTLLTPKENTVENNGDIHEINLNDFNPDTLTFSNSFEQEEMSEILIDDEPIPVFEEKKIVEHTRKELIKPETKTNAFENVEPRTFTNNANSSNKNKYQFPPIELLKKGVGGKGDSGSSLKAVADNLTRTLEIFGVKARISAWSQGPTVTRFELEPELGTKVSRIKSLSDDIKLSLATSDIRIEAPIPGKAAVGIEVPNKEPIPVLLRDLIDTPEFKQSSSNLTFAVGKDIAGKVIVYDIDQFPHLLIAGATGSGKSVCINTLIMSLIYKSHPDDVKLIMIDPKVVELSVYNGIPHLLLPVVTDPKKASGALNWAVCEMMDRYKKFADLNVRDLKGYNKEVENREESEIHKKLPRIVIIVDELADLIMVSKSEVEDSICRLAQLARACGIHLIVATQRPSVDVITGLIKANMPSRLAFAVSSLVDSRTILDMGGAEELLGKGDMLFFPKGLKKPVRLQGAFVSDNEINSIVDFLKKQGYNASNEEIDAKISAMSSQSSSGNSGVGGSSPEFDEYFMDCAKYIIQNDKASIGNLQRVFKIGFNRAARIMDKLAEIGVVSADEGTKARRVLMTMEEFENFVEENGI